MAVEDINNMISNVFPVVGATIGELDDFNEELMAAERLAAMLVASACIRHNKDPEQTKPVFADQFNKALDAAIYGQKQ